MLFNHCKDSKEEWLFSLTLSESGIKEAGGTHCDHCHSNRTPRRPALSGLGCVLD